MDYISFSDFLLEKKDNPSRIHRFKLNTRGRDYVVGDIHGAFNHLLSELTTIGFNFDNDRLFSVGDLINKGEDSHLAQEWLHSDWFYSVRGNHEDHFISEFAKTTNTGLVNIRNKGGTWFLQLTYDKQQEFINTLKKMPIAIEVETNTGLIGILHGSVPVGDWEDLNKELKVSNSVRTTVWEREEIDNHFKSKKDSSIKFEPKKVKNIDQIYLGHTPVNKPVKIKNRNYIDTGGTFHKSRRGYFTIIQIN